VNVVNISPSTSYEHVSVKLPIKAVTDSKAYLVPEWSASGFRIAGSDTDLGSGTVLPFKLLFPFDAFDLIIRVKAKVTRTNPSAKTSDLAFLGLTKRQNELLQYISDAYLSEELVSSGDLIEVVARTPKAAEMPKAAEPKSGPQRTRRAFGKVMASLALGALALGLTAYLASSAYQRVFVISAVSALVTVESSQVSSPAAGIATIVAKNVSLKVGDPIAEVTTLSGEIIKIASPCNCSMPAASQTGPTPIAPGSPILSLSHNDSKPQISAFVRYEDLLTLYRGASVKLYFADGSVIRDAKIASLPPLRMEHWSRSRLSPISTC
jgi:mannuronan synthase